MRLLFKLFICPISLDTAYEYTSYLFSISFVYTVNLFSLNISLVNFLSKSANIISNNKPKLLKLLLWLVVDACNNDSKLSLLVSSSTLVYTNF